jgi:hypothetical protein
MIGEPPCKRARTITTKVKCEPCEEEPPWVAPSRPEFQEFGLTPLEKKALRLGLKERFYLPPKSKFWKEICEGALSRVYGALEEADRKSWGVCVMHVLNIEVCRNPRDRLTLVKTNGTGLDGRNRWNMLRRLTVSYHRDCEVWAVPPFPATWSGLLELQMEWAQKEGILTH